jgi:hypothetical protein
LLTFKAVADIQLHLSLVEKVQINVADIEGSLQPFVEVLSDAECMIAGYGTFLGFHTPYA